MVVDDDRFSFISSVVLVSFLVCCVVYGKVSIRKMAISWNRLFTKEITFCMNLWMNLVNKWNWDCRHKIYEWFQVWQTSYSYRSSRVNISSYIHSQIDQNLQQLNKYELLLIKRYCSGYIFNLMWITHISLIYSKLNISISNDFLTSFFWSSYWVQ